MKIKIFYQDQFAYWKYYTTKHNEADSYRVAKRRAKATGRRHKLISEDGSLLDLLEP